MDSNGALLAVVARGDPEELRNALGGECNLEVRDEKGKSVLDLAALLGKAAALRVLVENGALVNGCNKSGYGALHWSAVWGQLACLKELVALGAPHDTKTRHGETAKDLAARYNHTECVEFMNCVDAKVTLKAAILGVREILGDNEKMQGKWNKDDKMKVTAACNEKLEWLEKMPDAMLAEIEEQRRDFCQRMEPHLAKIASGSDKT